MSTDVFKINCIHLKKVKELGVYGVDHINSVGEDPIENVSCEQQFKMMN